MPCRPNVTFYLCLCSRECAASGGTVAFIMSYKRSIVIGGSLVLAVLVVSGLTFYMSLGPCPEGTFSCDNDTVCVPQRQICDRRKDCSDGTDEHPVECGMYHGSKELIYKIMVTSMNIINGSFSEIDNYDDEFECDIETYPNFCSCKYKTMVYCGNHGIATIPVISPEVTHLLIIGNNLTLQSSALEGLNPVLLTLKYNNISEIPTGLFSDLGRLQKLFLGYNRIERLAPNVFKGLKTLRWLFLNSNRLHKFPLTSLRDLDSLQWLNLSENHLTLRDAAFPRIRNLFEMNLEFNLIEEVNEDTFAQLESLHFLSLAFNRIRYVHSRAFWKLKNLREIRLTGNPLKELSDGTFTKLSLLDALSLGKTELTITKELLGDINVTYLNLDGIEFRRIDFKAVGDIRNLQFVVFDKFYFCSMTPHVRKCKPNTDGVSSFEDLLTKPVLRYSTWMMAVFTLLGNVLVLWGRFIYRDENRAVTMVIRNLAVSDILMGLYLFVIGIQDFRYRSRYHEVALEWITSWSCAAVGVLAVTSSEVSMLILAFMSLERFLLIADPFSGHRRLNSRNVSICLATIWICGGIIAIAPVIMWRSSTRFYGTYSGTCFPLHIQERYPLGWEYSAFMFLGLNLFLLVMIALLYTALLISIWKTRRATPLAILDCEFAVRFFFIVLTDVTCWAPIIFTKIWAFLSYDISDDTYAWLVVFILPLNSAVNPLLYTFTTPKYRNQVLLRGWHKFTSRRKTDGSATSNPDESQGKIIPLLYQTASINNWKV